MALAVAALAACEKSAPYEPGAPMDLDKPNVYFSAYNSTNKVLASDMNEFEVALLRDDVETALTLPIKSACTYENTFVVPEEVNFPAGVDSISFKVQITDKFEMFKDYQLFLTVPEEYTHAYVPSETGPRYIANVVKEDYVPYAKGTYFCSFLDYLTGGKWPAWEQELEYSAIQDTFRFSDLWQPKTSMTFQWNRETNEVTVPKEEGFSINVDAGSGNISAFPLAGQYDAASQTLVIYVDMVDSSSWGEAFPQIYTITEFYE